MRLIGPIRRPLWLAAAVGEGVLEVALNVVRVRSALEEVVVTVPSPSVTQSPRRRPASESAPGLFDSTRRNVPPRAPDVRARPVAQSAGSSS